MLVKSGFYTNNAPIIPSTWSTINKSTGVVLSNGDQTAFGSTNLTWNVVLASVGRSSGIAYFEIFLDSAGPGLGNDSLGVCTVAQPLTNFVGSDSEGWGITTQPSFAMTRFHSGGGSAYTGSGGYDTGKTFGCVIDFSATTMEVLIDGVSSGTAFSGISGVVYPAASTFDQGTFTIKMRSSDFSFPIPPGAVAWIP